MTTDATVEENERKHDTATVEEKKQKHDTATVEEKEQKHDTATVDEKEQKPDTAAVEESKKHDTPTVEEKEQTHDASMYGVFYKNVRKQDVYAWTNDSLIAPPSSKAHGHYFTQSLSSLPPPPQRLPPLL